MSTDVMTFVEDSFRVIGKLPSTISGELLRGGRRNLYYLLSGLANRGLSLWCYRKSVLPIVAGKAVYELQQGTEDVYDALYREVNTQQGSVQQVGQDTTITLDTAASITTLEIELPSGVSTLAGYEILYSLDSATWVTAIEFEWTQPVVAGQPVCQDINNTLPALYWRVTAPAGSPAPSALRAYTLNYEQPMYKMNRDDYANLPNKTFQASQNGKSLQYFYDKQINPRVWIWPVGADSEGQLVIYNQRRITAPGDLTDLVDIPDRWQDAILYSLAWRNGNMLPPSELDKERLSNAKLQAEMSTTEAENSERDGSGIRLVPAIRGYTR